MATSHRNKTITTFLAALFGGIGMHRFYLHGRSDWLAWLRVASLPLSGLAILMVNNMQPLFVGLLFIFSILAGFIEALVIGLTPDTKWDAQHNQDSGQQSESHWILAVILVLTLGAATMGVIALLARSMDLWLTGGAYG